MAKSKRVPTRDAAARAGATGKPVSDSTGDGPWRGQETRPGAGGSESPEAAAVRAEGNAPVTVADAVRLSADDARGGTPAASRRPEPQAAADSGENVEEK